MTEEEGLLEVAGDAIRPWGGSARTRLVKWRENIVFDVTLTDGRRAALRLHRPGYQTRSAIESELDWTARLADAGLRVPRPVETRKGYRTAVSADRVVSVVTWLDGTPIGSAETPLPGNLAEQSDRMEAVGALIASMHGATDALDLPTTFDRPKWDKAGLLGQEPRWGRFWENPAFEPSDLEVISKAREQAAGSLDGLKGSGDFGLIHADCLRENILSHRGELALIDFDDSGWGWRLYDLATALFQSLEESTLAVQARAVLRGYGSRRALPEHPERALTLFLMLRSFASAGWIMTRASVDDPRLPFYAARARKLADAVLSGRTAWD